MTIRVELPTESKDFGRSPTIRITAHSPDDLFQIGRHSVALEHANAEFVIGTTEDGMGKYLRLPLCPSAAKSAQ